MSTICHIPLGHYHWLDSLELSQYKKDTLSFLNFTVLSQIIPDHSDAGAHECPNVVGKLGNPGNQ